MKIIIIGGSIGGLSAGIALRCKGFDVQIYERSSEKMGDRGAGLVIMPDMMQYLSEHLITPKETFGVPVYQRQILNSDGELIQTYKSNTSFTSWNHIWKQLKDYFPTENYFYGYELESIIDNSDSVTVFFKNGEQRNGDLVIGADGYSSKTRKHFLNDSGPTYAGYVAYRGVINEGMLTDMEIDFFDNKFSIYSYDHSHMLSYMIPGVNGELKKGERLYNWVWYVNKTDYALKSILEDKDGNTRNYSVPPGFLSLQSIDELHNLANEELPEIMRNRVLQTQDPFVQVIVDYQISKMYSQRVAVLGDAASVVRPHTASGTAKAYRDAINLANCLFFHHGNISAALAHWNDQQIRDVAKLAGYGKQLALRNGLGK